jgi:hypothetical protein
MQATKETAKATKTAKENLMATFREFATPVRLQSWLEVIHRRALKGDMKAVDILLSRALPEKYAVEMTGKLTMQADHRHLHAILPAGYSALKYEEPPPAGVEMLPLPEVTVASGKERFIHAGESLAEPVEGPKKFMVVTGRLSSPG